MEQFRPFIAPSLTRHRRPLSTAPVSKSLRQTNRSIAVHSDTAELWDYGGATSSRKTLLTTLMPTATPLRSPTLGVNLGGPRGTSWIAQRGVPGEEVARWLLKASGGREDVLPFAITANSPRFKSGPANFEVNEPK